MANIETIEIDALNFAEVAAPATPSAASVVVYAKSDGLLYSKDDAGTETLVSGGGSTFRKAVVYRTSTQAIATATWTSVGFDNEEVDADGVHDNVTNNSRLTIPASWNTRNVRVGANVEFSGNATGSRGARIIKNGATRLGEVIGPTAEVTLPVRLLVETRPLVVATADYFEVQMWQNSGGSVNTQATADSTLYFWAYTVD